MDQDALNFIRQSCVTWPGHQPSGARGPNAGGEQGFCSIDIADTDNDGLVHQEYFHRRMATARMPI